MQRKGVRSGRSNNVAFAAARIRPRRLLRLVVSLLLPAGCFLVLSGCAGVGGKNQSIVKVETKRNTARANRLTYAGIRALNKQHIDVAAKHFREAVEADYEYGPAHNNLGLMHYEQGNLYQAVMAFEQAREFLPNDPAVVYNLGLALESAGRTDEAVELYETATAMDRANPNYLGNLVRLRLRMGEHDDLLEQQLKDLVLIETRPDWRRWADIQLGLTINHALDRGPETPDFGSTANDASQAERMDLRDKIIDLTPVMPVSLEQSPGPSSGTADPGFDNLPDEPPMDLAPPMQPKPAARVEKSVPELMLEEGVIEDLTDSDYVK